MRISTSGGMRGLEATRAAVAGDVLLSLPTAFCLSITTCTHGLALAPRLQQLHGLGGDDEDEVVVADALVLLAEALVAGEASPWSNYLETLPREYDTPLNYTSPGCSALLEALPCLADAAQGRRNALLRALPTVRAALQALPGGALVRRMSDCALLSAMTWAAAATGTRMLALSARDATEASAARFGAGSGGAARVRLPGWMPDVGVMVPLVDLLNHPGPGQLANCRVDGTASAFTVTATRAISPGDPLMFDYRLMASSYCNWRWLLEYGLTLEDTGGDPAAAAAAATDIRDGSGGRGSGAQLYDQHGEPVQSAELQAPAARAAAGPAVIFDTNGDPVPTEEGAGAAAGADGRAAASPLRPLDCFGFRLSLDELLQQNGSSGGSSGGSATGAGLADARSAAAARLAAAGLGEALDAEVRGGRIDAGLLRWIGIALGTFRDIGAAGAGGGPRGAEGEAALLQRLQSIQGAAGQLADALRRRRPAAAAALAAAPAAECGQCPRLPAVVGAALGSLDAAVVRLSTLAADGQALGRVFTQPWLAAHHRRQQQQGER